MTQFLMLIKNRFFIFAVAYSFLLALIFNYLFFDKEIGISWFIFIFLVVFGQFIIMLINKRFSLDSFVLLCLSLFFSLMIGYRESYLLNFLNFITTLLLLLLFIRLYCKPRIKQFVLSDYIFSWFVFPGQIIFKSVKTLNENVQKLFGKKTSLSLPLIKGLLATAPLLIFFVILFVGADHSFRDFISNIFTFSVPDNVIGQLLIIVAMFLIVFGYYIFSDVQQELVGSEKTQVSFTTEILRSRQLFLLTFIWPIVLLFLVFIVFQLKYLFGGIENNDLTYAEYARHGFWELLVVTFISLVILLLVDKYSEQIKNRLTCFVVPGLLMIVELFIIVASALKRMALYQDNYGWTLSRFYVVGFIVFLTIILLFLSIKILLNKNNGLFLSSILFSGLLFLIAFNVINPDKFVVIKNVNHYYKTGQIDVNYLLTLSADSIPELIKLTEKISNDDRVLLLEGLTFQKQSLVKMSSDWQSFNLSRWRGLVLLSEYLK